MKRSIVLLLFAVIALSGCFTAEKLQPGAGTKLQVRGKTYDQVWAAAVQTASRDLDILEQDKQRGIIKADSTITFLTLGELVGIYISPTTPSAPSYTVSVESIRKGVFQTATAQDRTQAMISGMKLELGQY